MINYILYYIIKDNNRIYKIKNGRKGFRNFLYIYLVIWINIYLKYIESNF